MIYPIKVFDRDNNLVKEYDFKESLEMFAKENYTISDYERKNFWGRVWSDKNDPVTPDKCRPSRYKSRKKQRVINCLFCKAEIITASSRKKWCSDFCRKQFNKPKKEEVIQKDDSMLNAEIKKNSKLVNCKNCRQDFYSAGANSKWCSDKCRQSFKRMGYTDEEIEWQIERCNPYAYHVYLTYKPKNMTIMQVSEHSMVQAKEFCIRELKWRLRNWAEYTKSLVRDFD
jgi:hypothetical protein